MVHWVESVRGTTNVYRQRESERLVQSVKPLMETQT